MSEPTFNNKYTAEITMGKFLYEIIATIRQNVVQMAFKVDQRNPQTLPQDLYNYYGALHQWHMEISGALDNSKREVSKQFIKKYEIKRGQYTSNKEETKFFVKTKVFLDCWFIEFKDKYKDYIKNQQEKQI